MARVARSSGCAICNSVPSVAGLSSTTRFSSDALILPNDSVMVDFNEAGEETSKSLIVPIAASPVGGGSVWFVLRKIFPRILKFPYGP